MMLLRRNALIVVVNSLSYTTPNLQLTRFASSSSSKFGARTEYTTRNNRNQQNKEEEEEEDEGDYEETEVDENDSESEEVDSDGSQESDENSSDLEPNEDGETEHAIPFEIYQYVDALKEVFGEDVSQWDINAVAKQVMSWERDGPPNLFVEGELFKIASPTKVDRVKVKQLAEAYKHASNELKRITTIGVNIRKETDLPVKLQNMIYIFGKFNKFREMETTFDLFGSWFGSNVKVYNILMRAYGRAQSAAQAEAVLVRMLKAKIEPNTESYCTMIRAYADAELPGKMHEIFGIMDAKKMVPDENTYKSMMRGYTIAGQEERVQFVCNRMENAGYNSVKALEDLLTVASRKNELHDEFDFAVGDPKVYQEHDESNARRKLRQINKTYSPLDPDIADFFKDHKD